MHRSFTSCERFWAVVERRPCAVGEPPTASPFGHPCTLGVSCRGPRVCHDVQGDIITERQLVPVRPCAVVVVEWSRRVKFLFVIPHSPAALHGQRLFNFGSVKRPHPMLSRLVFGAAFSLPDRHSSIHN